MDTPLPPEPKLPGLMESLIKSLYFAKQEIINREQVSIEVFVQKISPDLDSYVIKEEAEGAINLVSGEVFLCIGDDESKCHIEADLYFKNKEKKWIKKSIKTESVPMEWALIPSEQEKLKASKKIKFPYEHP